MDRRVQRTHQLLRDSLIALTLERGYDAVTIQDITERANLGRTTFYLHYRDKDELLLRCLEEFVDEIGQRIDPMLEGLIRGETTSVKIAFDHAQENHDLYLTLLRAQGAARMAREMRTRISTHVTKQIQRARPKTPPVPIEIAATYLAVSLIGMLEWWLENGMPYPADYMAEAFYRLGVSSILTSMGLELPTPS